MLSLIVLFKIYLSLGIGKRSIVKVNGQFLKKKWGWSRMEFINTENLKNNQTKKVTLFFPDCRNLFHGEAGFLKLIEVFLVKYLSTG